ncbi:hypothetical protein OG871_27760 [Kitasatospora sp. NBC_00374]|uniref:hypothetical protein n=1 Tax=Kitasatospora sp. NBC_00374 TaxID=2975964 RepID=UPI0030E5D567
MDPTIATLAMTAATTIVGAMATSAWETTRTGVTGLFRRRGAVEQAAIAAQLDQNAALVLRTADPESARRSVTPLWQLQMEDFLSQHPEAAQELQTLLDRIQPQLPQAQENWVMNIVGLGGITVGTMGPGSGVHIHNSSNPARPRPTTGPATTADDARADTNESADR